MAQLINLVTHKVSYEGAKVMNQHQPTAIYLLDIEYYWSVLAGKI